MIAAARQGQFDLLIVHRLDRFSRNRTHFSIYRELLRRAGVQLVSISEPTQEDAAGQFINGVLECAAEFYSIRLSEETRKGKKARAEAGYWNGDPPIGYCRGLCEQCQDPNGPDYCAHVGEPNRSDGRVLIPHPRDHKAVQTAYKLYVSGKVSDRDVANVLNRAGYRTNRKYTVKPRPKRPGGPGPFARDTVREMLTKPFYIGLVSYKGRLIEGQHEPIIESALFERVQQVCALLRQAPRNQKRAARVYPLSGLLYCGHCGRRLYGQYSASADRRYYRDEGVRQGVTQCTPPFVRADELEGQIAELMSSLKLPPDWEKQAASYYAGWGSVEELENKRAALSTRKQRLVDLYKVGMISQEDMETEAVQIRSEEEKLNP
jgi:site-specific DNA recombinase